MQQRIAEIAMTTFITDKDFNEIKDIMYQQTGVFLKPSKKNLVIARLRTRLRELDCPNFKSYLEFFKKKDAAELEILINAITTNETFFFRHPKQFNFLSDYVLPEIIEKKKILPRREIRVWSAACSTGEEPYSLAVACEEFFKKHPAYQYTVFASDINSAVLAEAQKGMFPERSFRETPSGIQQRYFKRVEIIDGRRRKEMMKFTSDIKDNIVFIQNNLLHPFPFKNIDIVFLRNALIYFNEESKQKVINNIENVIVPKGYLFLGLSETLFDVKSTFEILQTGTYLKQD
ncbi:MAG: protein-glutamate O-methyltransferase CheR [Candidatus Omnitrophica bacterium]|nr:protein-glutamate O-methyltransferase CheR [Candidatus Omnitrophota bacterium]